MYEIPLHPDHLRQFSSHFQTFKGSEKTSRFVLTFRDYLVEKFSNADAPSTSAGAEDKNYVQMISFSLAHR